MATTYTTAQIAELLESVSNWGRWGKEDQRGALNYIMTRNARLPRGLVSRTGDTVSLSLPLRHGRGAATIPIPVTHLMIRSVQIGHPRGSSGCGRLFRDIEPHGLADTHLDALCHHFLARQNVQRLRCRRGRRPWRAQMRDRLAARRHNRPRRAARHPQDPQGPMAGDRARAIFRPTWKRPKGTITCKSAKASMLLVRTGRSTLAARQRPSERALKDAPGCMPRVWDGCTSGASRCWAAR